MKLAVSNIAWRPEDASSAYALLENRGVRGLEIAPGLLFPEEHDPFAPSPQAVLTKLQQTADAGLQLVSMQSLLFGVSDALLFGDAGQRSRFEAGLVRAIELAARLGIGKLVVGSPMNRTIPLGMERDQALEIAVDAFARLAEVAQKNACRLAMEANPPPYGTNFLNTFEDVTDFATRVNHPALGVNLDIGALYMTGEFEKVSALVEENAALLVHVHISEPNLAPLSTDPYRLRRCLTALAGIGWTDWVSIEMRATPEPTLSGIDSAIRISMEAIAA